MNKFEEAYLKVLNEDANLPAEGEGTPLDQVESRLDFLKKEYSNKEPTKEAIAELLNIAIIDELLAEYNYFASWNLSKTDGKADYDPEFQAHESQERDHRYKLVQRLREMDMPVPTIPFAEYAEKNSDGNVWKQEMDFDSGKIIMNRLQEEQKAVAFYSFVLGFIGLDKTETKDTTTYRLIRQIKADEEQHVKDLRDLAVEHGLMKPFSKTQEVDPTEAEQPVPEAQEEVAVGDVNHQTAVY